MEGRAAQHEDVGARLALPEDFFVRREAIYNFRGHDEILDE